VERGSYRLHGRAIYSAKKQGTNNNG
jgi:hypothetical protein